MLLQVNSGNNRHPRLPEQLLSRRDAVTSARIQPVIKCAEQGDPEERKQDGVGGGVDYVKEEGECNHDSCEQEPAHRRCPLFDDVPLRAKLSAYALTESCVLQEA